MKTEIQVQIELTKQMKFRKELVKKMEMEMKVGICNLNPMWERIIKHVDTRILALKWMLDIK
jgi:hypothetical protein